MAQRARLEESLLAVKRRCPRRPTGFAVGSGIRVALQAEQIDVAYAQHVRIGASVRNVAGRASLDFYGLMFEHERPLLVGVAGEADGILCRRGTHLLWPDRAVRIMAIGALDQALVYAMMKWHFELGLLL